MMLVIDDGAVGGGSHESTLGEPLMLFRLSFSHLGLRCRVLGMSGAGRRLTGIGLVGRVRVPLMCNQHLDGSVAEGDFSAPAMREASRTIVSYALPALTRRFITNNLLLPESPCGSRSVKSRASQSHLPGNIAMLEVNHQ